MRIAQVPPLYESVPPQLYGGTERVVAILCDALVLLGHDVTLFATADAATQAKLVVVRDQAIRLDPHPLKSDVSAHLAMLHEVRARAADFDVIHFHIDLLHMPMFEAIADRTLTTLHGRLDIKDLAESYRRWPDFPLVSISDIHRQPLPHANWVATIHHGIPVDLIRPPARPRRDYLAFLGRISPEKGPDRAIAIAHRLEMPLRIAAKIDDVDQHYFRDCIEPLLANPLVEYVGEISDQEKSDFLGHAAALLFPIDWPEPFGLVLVEAMAAGAPIVAFRCGAVPEIVQEGINGLIVESVEQAVLAVRQVSSFDRRTIRRTFEQRFTAEIMARKYLDVYWNRAIAAELRNPLKAAAG